ncbi:HNH endonuclease [Sphingomonas immobilis]|uniref:HNH endonuclease signature motif containing protein n=1 Tax=Sphingomonas immobilis TaxID=3063997 RepID=A0ABT8ZU33_9SPHN|nr:HNH endonuclease signature motif containing protein [Sphingomonas sp. CA1-15]MDO7841091.1 HNH endonuclease signature motif containing protein [Sphingomonas sp. CA1-15]
MPSKPPPLTNRPQRKAWKRSQLEPDTRLRGRAGMEQRRRRLMAEPLCRACAKLSIVRAAVVPDHIIPLSEGGRDDDGNIQCLCQEHHDAKSKAERAAARQRRRP